MKKILVIRCGALGDLVYATSVIDALILEYGNNIMIDFLCTPSSSMLFKNDKRINEVFLLKHKKIPIIFSGEKKTLIKHSKSSQYDLLINYESGRQFKSLVLNIQAKKKIGNFFDEINIDTTLNRGAVIKTYLKNIISKENLNLAQPRLHTENFDMLKNKFSLKSNYIVFSPSNSHIRRSGINYRAWDNNHWNELIKTISKKIQIVIVGAKGEEFFFKNFEPYPDNVINLVAKNNIIELNTIVSNAKAVVCTDSSLGHIAAAVNTPVFVMMGPNNIITDSPYETSENSVIVLTSKKDCSPCYKSDVMNACQDNICMKEISPKIVYTALKNEKII
jgi:heptosyltransferase-3